MSRAGQPASRGAWQLATNRDQKADLNSSILVQRSKSAV